MIEKTTSIETPQDKINRKISAVKKIISIQEEQLETINQPPHE